MPTIARLQIDLDGNRLTMINLETGEKYLDNEEILLPESFRIEISMSASEGVKSYGVENEW